MSKEYDSLKAFLETLKIDGAIDNLSLIFYSIHRVVVGGSKSGVIALLDNLLSTMTEYRGLAKSEANYWEVVQHIRDVKAALESDSKSERQVAWQRIEVWRQARKPSFILDFDALRKLANLD